MSSVRIFPTWHLTHNHIKNARKFSGFQHISTTKFPINLPHTKKHSTIGVLFAHAPAHTKNYVSPQPRGIADTDII